MRRLTCLFLFLLFLLPAPSLAGPLAFDPAPWRARAAVFLDQGRFLECLDAYDAVRRHAALPSDRALALVRMGDVLALFLERKDKALEAYEAAIRGYGHLPQTENAYFNTAMILYEQGRLKESLAAFTAYARHYSNGRHAGTAAFMLERIPGELASGVRPEPMAPEPLAMDREPVVRVSLGAVSSLEIDLVRGGSWPPGRYEVKASTGGLVLSGSNVGLRLEFGDLKGEFRLGGKAYAGKLVLSLRNNKILAVNVLPMESYLSGVVPREMPASWEAQALMAQAVAARTYAAYLASKSKDKPYDVAAGTASQVYGGLSARDPRSDAAVAATRGMVLTHSGAYVLAYFHSHSGGMLEDDKLVWTADLPYYSVRPDQVSTRARDMSWSFSVSRDDLSRALAASGFQVGRVDDLLPGEVSPSGRPATLRVLSRGGVTVIKSNTLRLALGAERMKSTLCGISLRGDDFIFKGRGFGHGVGLSQWGARGMAREGSSYQDILAHYYRGADLKTVY